MLFINYDWFLSNTKDIISIILNLFRVMIIFNLCLMSKKTSLNFPTIHFVINLFSILKLHPTTWTLSYL